MRRLARDLAYRDRTFPAGTLVRPATPEELAAQPVRGVLAPVIAAGEALCVVIGDEARWRVVEPCDVE